MDIRGKSASNTRKNVLLVTGVFPPGIGGMQQYYYHLCRTTGHRMTVVAPVYGTGDDRFDRGRPYRVIRRRFLRNESIDVRSWPRLLYHTIAAIRKFKPDVTIYGYILIGFIGMLLQFFWNKKYVVSVHGKDLLEFRKIWGLHALSKMILRRADGVLANSMYTKKIAMGYGAEERKIRIVYPGVESIFERGGKNERLIRNHGLENKFVLITVGRLVKRKGHDMVIRSLPRILQRIPNAVYVIVGDGPERNELERLAKREGIDGNVVFVGSVGDIGELEQYYRSSDVFVMTSRLLEDKGDVEGFGIVYLEAASCGLPAVAGRTGGVEEAVIDKMTGLIVDPLSEQEIADAVVNLHDDPAMRDAMSQAGYRRAKSSFQYDQIVNKMDAFLTSVVDGETAPSGEGESEGKGAESHAPAKH